MRVVFAPLTYIELQETFQISLFISENTRLRLPINKTNNLLKVYRKELSSIKYQMKLTPN